MNPYSSYPAVTRLEGAGMFLQVSFQNLKKLDHVKIT